MKNKSDNAAFRNNYASEIYQLGVDKAKFDLFNIIPEKYVQLHNEGYIHIHDAEAYGKVNNCSTPDLISFFETIVLDSKTEQGKIFEIINRIKQLITNIALSQSGGIGFANFDCDIDVLFNKYDILLTPVNIDFFNDCICEFLTWINTTRTRFCREPYYLSFNIGLSCSGWGKITAKTLLNTFMNMPLDYTRPNIIFKVNRNINSSKCSPNYDIFKLALSCTAKRMIPTYLLTDSNINNTCNPQRLGIMGCRTRVYNNVNGSETTIGRGNIANVSINLPRLAIESSNLNEFFSLLDSMMNNVSELLIDRTNRMKVNGEKYFQYIFQNKIWTSVNSIDDMLKQGTLSIGFIGLSETVEVLTGTKYHMNAESYQIALNIIKHMRDFTDNLRDKYSINFSLLATPGEMISGRFCELDKKHAKSPIQDNDFYTNSFHVPVDSQISIFEKINYEAPFHSLCNGGCITYVEFRSAPLTNILALEDAINHATLKGISYLGFNYPLDICNDCKTIGTFDNCPKCNSNNIKRIRRVSGYLEDLNYFTEGKKAEESFRKPNVM